MYDAIVRHMSGHKLDNPILVQLDSRKLLVPMLCKHFSALMHTREREVRGKKARLPLPMVFL